MPALGLKRFVWISRKEEEALQAGLFRTKRSGQMPRPIPKGKRFVLKKAARRETLRAGGMLANEDWKELDSRGKRFGLAS